MLSDPSTDDKVQLRSNKIRESGGLDEIEENEEQLDTDDAGSGVKVEPKVEDHDEELENWEEKLEEHTEGSKNHIQDWKDL